MKTRLALFHVSIALLSYCFAEKTLAAADVLVPTGAIWKYLDNGSDQGTAWRSAGFNDASWASGPAQLGYGDGDEATVVSFGPGAADMTAAALLVGFARTIEVVLSDGQVIDTVIHGIAGLLVNFGAEASAIGMLVVQTICNFFIPSGSGQAFVTMPIMSPLATLTGVPQQTAVIAYQFGDGFTNMIVPTSALVMGALALGRIPYGAWVRFIAPLLAKLFALAVVFLVLTIHIGDAVGLNPR
jgi:hypothetical protein